MAKKPEATRASKKKALWMTEKEPFAFLAIKKTDDPLVSPPFATGGEAYVQEVLSRWRAGEEPVAESDEVEEPELELEDSQEAALSSALSKAVAFASAQTHLISVTTLAPTIFNHVHITSNIFKPVEDSAERVHDDDVGTVYALDKSEYENLDKARKTLLDLRLGVAALPNATLMSLVATFDALVAELVAKMLRLNTTWMARGDRKLGFDKIANATSIRDIMDEVIRDEIYQFSRGSHDEQAKYIESNFGVSIKRHWKRWADYIEIFERRNLIAHGELKFNDRYVSICEDAGHKGSKKILGHNVEVRSGYLTQALNILTEFAVLLPFSVWRKISEEQEEKAFSQLNEAAYYLILDSRYEVAERVLEFALSLTKVKVPVVIIQRLTVNRASALRHLGRVDEANAVLDSVDWSASSDLFQVCMHSVRGDAATVAKLLPRFANSSELNAATFKQWPCFSFVRDDDAVKDAFLTTFGEPLSVPASQTPASEEGAETDVSDETPTVH